MEHNEGARLGRTGKDEAPQSEDRENSAKAFDPTVLERVVFAVFGPEARAAFEAALG